MNIPHNSLMEKIKELVRLCEQIASDYGDDASWFKQPASDEMISNWENKHNVFIPETNCQGLFNQIHRKLTKGARSTVWLLTPHLTDYIFPFSRSLQRYA